MISTLSRTSERYNKLELNKLPLTETTEGTRPLLTLATAQIEAATRLAERFRTDNDTILICSIVIASTSQFQHNLITSRPTKSSGWRSFTILKRASVGKEPLDQANFGALRL